MVDRVVSILTELEFSVQRKIDQLQSLDDERDVNQANKTLHADLHSLRRVVTRLAGFVDEQETASQTEQVQSRVDQHQQIVKKYVYHGVMRNDLCRVWKVRKAYN
jgi:hypothetical protein